MRSDFSLNSKHLTIVGRNTVDFSVFPPGAGVFFAKKNPPGVNSKVEGGSLKKKKKELLDDSTFLCPFQPDSGGGAQRILRYIDHQHAYIHK